MKRTRKQARRSARTAGFVLKSGGLFNDEIAVIVELEGTKNFLVADRITRQRD